MAIVLSLGMYAFADFSDFADDNGGDEYQSAPVEDNGGYVDDNGNDGYRASDNSRDRSRPRYDDEGDDYRASDSRDRNRPRYDDEGDGYRASDSRDRNRSRFDDEDDGYRASDSRDRNRSRFDDEDDGYRASDSRDRNRSRFDDEDDGYRASDSRDRNRSRFDDEDDGYRSVDSRDRRRSRNADEDRSQNDESSFEDVSYRDLDADKKQEEKKPGFFDDPFHVGVHLGIGYAGTWNNENAYGMYYEPNSGELYLAEKDPYNGYNGILADFGVILNYHLGKYLSVVPEINFRIIDYFRESDCWYLKVTHNDGTQEAAPLDENMMMMDLNVPLVLRVTPAPVFFIDLGAEANVNFTTKYSLSNDDYDYEEDMGGVWKARRFMWGIVFGAGTTLDVDGLFFDIGARAVIDMSAFEEDQLVDMFAMNGTYRNPVGTRMWGIQLVLNYYIK